MHDEGEGRGGGRELLYRVIATTFGIIIIIVTVIIMAVLLGNRIIAVMVAVTMAATE